MNSNSGLTVTYVIFRIQQISALKNTRKKVVPRISQEILASDSYTFFNFRRPLHGLLRSEENKDFEKDDILLTTDY
jgi:hypothetical protein